jgi:hypothetical protein
MIKNLRWQLAVIGLVAAFVSANAAPTIQKSTAPVGKKRALAAGVFYPAVPNGAGSLNLLRDAYDSLYVADHDYKGHRARAMHQIEDAMRLYGVNIRGEGRGHEKQGTSDSQLHEAQTKLEQSLGGLAGKPAHHVREAIKQLTVALNVK